MFAVVALTPLSVYPGGAPVPPTVPNPFYAPDILYGVTKLTDWFEQKDNALIAQTYLQAPEGTYKYVLADDQIHDNKIILASRGIMPEVSPFLSGAEQGLPERPGIVEVP